MELQKLAESLNPIERKIIKVLDKHNFLNDVALQTKLTEVEVMRAFQFLQNKNIAKLEELEEEKIDLDINGIEYKNRGLPERKFLEAILEKPLGIDELGRKSGLSKEEIAISIGVLKSKAAIETKKENILLISITDHGKSLLRKGFPEEHFLNENFPKPILSLKPEEKFLLETLKKRKRIVKVDVKKKVAAHLTQTGKKLLEVKLEDDLIEKVTPSLLKAGAWKSRKFRRYDVRVNVPEIFGGRKHHYRNFLDEIRRKFVSLGFKELQGPIVETDFWNMDALFMPQFHSARDIHQGYYIREPKYSKGLPEEIVKKVKEAHENGFGTGSRGWKYEFDIKKTHRNILRTHDTSISARTLASKDLQVPGKYFQIARCFRYDVIDATHLPDFNQVGGIVIEEGIHFGHLKALLRMFAEEFANSNEIKIVPSYFPFTEPSAQLMVKHEKLGWIELAGSGIFRPELVKPLVGKEVPVIAWGVGLDRLAMFNMGINDIRHLFSHDLEFLRSVKMI